jgi:uncharacterized protein (DUF1810 family)
VSDRYNLQRFLDAQEGTFPTALSELNAGLKQGHWMWFILPQLAGLGVSPTARYFGIRSLDEARAYLEHPLLGTRLRQCVEALSPWAQNCTAEQILGSIDAMKLRSSLTLFDQAEPVSLFRSSLDQFFDGEADQRTLALLNGKA